MKKFLIAAAITGAFGVNAWSFDISDEATDFVYKCSELFMDDAKLAANCFENGKFPGGKMPSQFQDVKNQMAKKCKKKSKISIECGGMQMIGMAIEMEDKPGVYHQFCSVYCDGDDRNSYLDNIYWYVKKKNGKFVVDTDSLE